jgi:two-component system, cell cycle response regulator
MLNEKKILIVDQNKIDIQIIKLLLNTCDVVSFKGGDSKIINLIKRENPDCILLGHDQQSTNSIDILNKLKSHDELGRKIPIIMLVDHDSVDLVQEITQKGACDYLVKGFYAKNTLIKTIIIAIERQKLVNTVYEQQQELKKLTILDELTGLFNRRALIKGIEDHIQLSRRYKYSLSIAVCDIDEFKYINDSYGHVTGDSILIEVGNIFTSRIRKTDIAGRHGGDEFIILFPNTPVKNAARIIEKIREKVMHVCQFSDKFNRIKTLEQHNSLTQFNPLSVTLSFGVAEITPDVISADDLIAKADNALYFAKNAGKNLVAYLNKDELEIYKMKKSDKDC